MTNYLAKFKPDYSEPTAPLRELLHQDVDWCWLELHTAAFPKLKELIAGPPVLRYFDVHQPVVLCYGETLPHHIIKGKTTELSFKAKM
jgi:hypothetical protein